ncbi:MAG TPA: thioredoxin domain-containing protein [Pyrinomonadaceae bacterium]|nr:thioredoxin domain-containing protein [Pyrinomonadaceae bacterium]
MKNTPQAKSNTPILIIGAVLVIAALGAWYLYSSSKAGSNSNTAKANNANAANTAKQTSIPPNAPQGATPPNQSGSPAALVTIEEFADFQCPQCAATHPIMNEIKSTYGSRIHFIYRNYPLDIPAHDKSYEASVSAEAAGMQGKFWDMQNLLFTNQRAWTADANYKQIWKDYAQKIGLDVPKWENDMAGIATKARVDEDKKRAKAIGVNSTPTVYINNIEVPFAQVNVAGLKQIIDGELAKASPQGQPAPAAPAAPANK